MGASFCRLLTNFRDLPFTIINRTALLTLTEICYTYTTICQFLIDVNKYSFEQIKGDYLILLIEVMVLYRCQLFRKQYNWDRVGRLGQIPV